MKPLGKEAVDQTIHFVAALAVAYLARTDPLGGAVVGFALAVVREVTEGGDILSAGSLRDTLFWTLGGGIGGWL